MRAGIPSVHLTRAAPNTHTHTHTHLHARALQYFEGPCLKEELYAEAELVRGIEKHVPEALDGGGSVTFASADLGRPLWVQSFAKCVWSRARAYSIVCVCVCVCVCVRASACLRVFYMLACARARE